MTTIVERNCTEVVKNDRTQEDDTMSVRLSELRSAPAYVLLGEPGLGKSTALRQECELAGELAAFVDARDFLTLDLDRHPELHGKALFIDGLDEVRTGAVDARTALDEIRHRLDALGRPKFRLACREADWLGNNDLSRLRRVSPSSQIRVLHLDPLSDDDIELILRDHPRVGDPQGFIANAQFRGVGDLLSNPQTLNMLAEVVRGGEQWPTSRTATFEMACKVMAREQNEEHQIGASQPPLEELLNAAGFVRAALLITGSAGVSLDFHDSDVGYFSLDSFGTTSVDVARAAVATRLFRGLGQRRFAPIHRHVAEFLAARYLASRIEAGLSVRRILSLICGSDGVVVSEMRGLSGWIAALCPQSRDVLIERDLVGVALYGDLADFSVGERSLLLQALCGQDAVAPLLLDSGGPESGLSLAPLTAEEMEPTLAEVLGRPSRETKEQHSTRFVLGLLRKRAASPKLAPLLYEIVRDQSSWPDVRSSALDALLMIKEAHDESTEGAKRLLEDIHAGVVTDHEGELTGRLLSFLYPHAVPPRRVWHFLNLRERQNYYGLESLFWDTQLLQQSSDLDVIDLLDELSVRFQDVWPALDSHNAGDIVFRLLARGLKVQGESLTVPHLHAWLTAAVPPMEEVDLYEAEALEEVRAWLEERPDIQKSVILHGLSRWPHGEHTFDLERSVIGPMQRYSLPAEFGAWYAEHAVRLAPSHPEASAFLLRQAFRSYLDDVISLDLLRARVKGVKAPEDQLSALLQGVRQHEQERANRWHPERAAKREAERQRGIDFVREHVEALRQNEAPLSLVRDLGNAYFRYPLSELEPSGPIGRLANLLGGNNDLVEAALIALCQSLWRSDLPEADEVIRLSTESRQHLIAYPVQAGLDCLHNGDSEVLQELSEDQIRTALALYYCSPAGFAQPPDWHDVWVEQTPGLVASVATETAIARLRHDGLYWPALRAIELMSDAPEIRHDAILKVLAKFPLRASIEKLAALRSLLWQALRLPNQPSFVQLIDSRLRARSMSVAQRTHWLAAGAIVDPERFRDRMVQFVGENERRTRHLVEFLGGAPSLETGDFELNVETLRVLIELMGPSFAPGSMYESGSVTTEMKGSEQVGHFIRQLGALPGSDATEVLAALASNPNLNRWHEFIARNGEYQRALHREATFVHPTLGQLQQSLSDAGPANAADLAALLLERLDTVASDIKSSNADKWRQYWNEDSHGRPESPKHEDSCRDALMDHLRPLLPRGVDAQPEGQYVGDKRSDIRVSSSSFNVPVEIKKVCHRDLWRAMKTQLIGKYARDTATSGYGIYLVLWWQDAEMTPPPVGIRPSALEDFKARLEESLSYEESRKNSVVVLDVSPVRSPTLPTPVTSPSSSRNEGPTPCLSISPAEVYPNGWESADR